METAPVEEQARRGDRLIPFRVTAEVLRTTEPDAERLGSVSHAGSTAAGLLGVGAVLVPTPGQSVTPSRTTDACGSRGSAGRATRSRRPARVARGASGRLLAGVARRARDDDRVVVRRRRGSPARAGGSVVAGRAPLWPLRAGSIGSTDHGRAHAERIVCGEAHLVAPVRRRRAISMPAISSPDPAASSAPIGEPVNGQGCGHRDGAETVGVAARRTAGSAVDAGGCWWSPVGSARAGRAGGTASGGRR